MKAVKVNDTVRVNDPCGVVEGVVSRIDGNTVEVKHDYWGEYDLEHCEVIAPKQKQIKIEITEEDVRQFQNLLSGNEESVVWSFTTEDGSEDIEVVFEG